VKVKSRSAGILTYMALWAPLTKAQYSPRRVHQSLRV